jgi:hypothetical protein
MDIVFLRVTLLVLYRNVVIVWREDWAPHWCVVVVLYLKLMYIAIHPEALHGSATFLFT